MTREQHADLHAASEHPVRPDGFVEPSPFCKKPADMAGRKGVPVGSAPAQAS
jgi:hypothetical protein